MNTTTLTTSQAAKFLQVSERTLFNLRKSGQLAASRIGSCVRYDLAELARLLERTKERADVQR